MPQLKRLLKKRLKKLVSLLLVLAQRHLLKGPGMFISKQVSSLLLLANMVTGGPEQLQVVLKRQGGSNHHLYHTKASLIQQEIKNHSRWWSKCVHVQIDRFLVHVFIKVNLWSMHSLHWRKGEESCRRQRINIIINQVYLSYCHTATNSPSNQTFFVFFSFSLIDKSSIWESSTN